MKPFSVSNFVDSNLNFIDIGNPMTIQVLVPGKNRIPKDSHFQTLCVICAPLIKFKK
jgi:hypothetical protein